MCNRFIYFYLSIFFVDTERTKFVSNNIKGKKIWYEYFYPIYIIGSLRCKLPTQQINPSL
jgi:hypothetical protein